MVFKRNIHTLIQLSSNSVNNFYNTRAICLITRLRLGLRHLREHRFKHVFQDTLNLMCSCGKLCKEHFLHHFLLFVNQRYTFLSTLGNFNYSLLENTSNVLTQTLFFGTMSLSESGNSNILNVTIDFFDKRFDEQTF